VQFKGGAIEFDRDKYCPTLGNAWVEVVCSVQLMGGGAIEFDREIYVVCGVRGKRLQEDSAPPPMSVMNHVFSSCSDTGAGREVE
jgi:hypothetical protein